MDNPDLITTAEAAALLRLQPGTLRRWKMEKRNLAVYKLARKANRYSRAEVLAFLEKTKLEPVR